MPMQCNGMEYFQIVKQSELKHERNITPETRQPRGLMKGVQPQKPVDVECSHLKKTKNKKKKLEKYF